MNMMVWRRTATLLVLSCSLLSPQARLAQAQDDRATDSGWPQFSGRGFGGGGFGGFHGGGFGGFHGGSRR